MTEETFQLSLSMADYQLLLNAIENPQPPSAELLEAVRRLTEQVEEK